MKIIGLIPARSGSKTVLNKNIIPIAGKPLIAWTIEAALQSSVLDHLFVSTDDQDIADIATQYHAPPAFMRPADIADDKTPALAVIQHCLNYCDTNNIDADYICYLQPTSPLRTCDDITNAVQLIDQANQTIVSVMKTPHQFLPSSQMTQNNDQDRLEFYDPSQSLVLRRQDKATDFYARNGPAILLCNRHDILSDRLYGDHITPYIMPYHRSFDIDDHDDVMLVERLLQDKN